MTATPPSVGSYVLLYPEDVGDWATEPFYGVVSSVTGRAAIIKGLGHGNGRSVSVAKERAAQRQVQRAEATGLRPGIWLRKAVCYEMRGFFYFGQVTGYNGSRLSVATYLGVRMVECSRVAGDVYPVVAMALGTRRWPKRLWPYSRLEGLQDQLVERLLTGAGGRPHTITEWLDEVRIEVGDLSDRQVAWVNPISGIELHTSLAHIMRYIYYIDGGRPIPDAIKSSIGPSFCEEPRETASGVSPARGSEASFFEPLADDEDDRSPREGTAPMPPNRGVQIMSDQPEAVASRSSRSVPVPAPVHSHSRQAPNLTMATALPTDHRRELHFGGIGGSTEPSYADQELEVVDLIRRYRPDLLEHYLRQADGKKRARPPADGNEPPIKRYKTEFSPSEDQVRAHAMLTADEHAGKSGDDFLRFVTAAPTVPFMLHPGVMARIYDLQFGSRGLSIMHFRRVGFIDKLRTVEQGRTNPSDFTLAPPRPAIATAWSDLSLAARSFVDYCRMVCDPCTIKVAEALDRFITALEGWKQFKAAELPLLVLWIDATLEKYRSAVVQDSYTMAESRHAAAAWFSMANPEIQSLILTALAERLGGSASFQPNRADRQRTGGNGAMDRRIPADVAAMIPMQDDKEVCLHFLSMRGCNSRDPDRCTFKNRAHFWPERLPEKLREYIRTRLGGLAKAHVEA